MLGCCSSLDKMFCRSRRKGILKITDGKEPKKDPDQQSQKNTDEKEGSHAKSSIVNVDTDVAIKADTDAEYKTEEEQKQEPENEHEHPIQTLTVDPNADSDSEYQDTIVSTLSIPTFSDSPILEKKDIIIDNGDQEGSQERNTVKNFWAFLSFDNDGKSHVEEKEDHATTLGAAPEAAPETPLEIAEEKVSEEVVSIHIEALMPPQSTSLPPPPPPPPPQLTIKVTPDTPISAHNSVITENVNNSNRSLQKSPSSATTSARSRKEQKHIEKMDKEKQALQKLAAAIPGATEAEYKRFYLARKGDYEGALKQLQSYVEWRKECHLDDENEIYGIHSPMSLDDFESCASSVGAQDRADWKSASKAAILLSSNESDKNISTFNQNQNNFEEKSLPQLAYMVTEIRSTTFMKDKENNRILQLLPAQIDMSEADETTYALAIAFYLDKKLSRNSTEKVVVSVDVRAGYGWANPPAKKIVPFIKSVVSLLERNFPERLSKCILYPLPAAATVLWKMIKVFLDPTTREKIIVIGGGSGINDTVSPKKFNKIMDESVHKRMEEVRKEAFVTQGKNSKIGIV